MNINEVEKQVKFNMFVTCLIYVLTGLCFIVSIIAIATTPVHAANSNINTNSYSTCGGTSSSTYGAFYSGSCHNASIGTTYTGKATTLGFRIKKSFVPGNYYTLTINMKDNDLLGSSYIDVVRLIDIQNNNNEYNVSYTFVSKKQFKVYFSVPVNTSDIAISLSSGSGDPITGVSTFGVASLYLDDNDNTEDIINNQNQNTSDIMNNANTNTQTIVDVLNDNINNTNQTIWETSANLFHELVNMCPNQIDINYVGNCILNNNTGALVNCTSTISNRDIQHGAFYVNTTETWKGFSTNRINVVANQEYHLKFYWTSQNVNRLFYKIYFYDVNDVLFSTNGAYIDNMGNFNVSITSPNQPLHPLGYARIDVELPTAGYVYFKELQFSPKSVPFCQYGTTNGNKLDGIEGAIQGGLSDVNDSMQDVKDIQQDTYDYMIDDTNPVVDNSGINNVISNVQINNPLSYVLTLPLHLISKINQIFSVGTCSPVDLGAFGFASDYHFVLPCINFENYLGSTLWNTIDVFVSIGLLAFTLYKIYHAVANILTLGGEDEVTYHLGYLSPMEFLAEIIGNGGFGVVVGKGKNV